MAIPQLGPPLPGDLGRPILSARERGEPVPQPPVAALAASAVDPQEQLRLQEMEAARLSGLFAEATTAISAGTLSESDGAQAASTGSFFPATSANAVPRDAIDRREAFLDETVDRRTVSPDRLQAPPSPYVLQAGTVIPAALVTGLRSGPPWPDRRAGDESCLR